MSKPQTPIAVPGSLCNAAFTCSNRQTPQQTITREAPETRTQDNSIIRTERAQSCPPTPENRLRPGTRCFTDRMIEPIVSRFDLTLRMFPPVRPRQLTIRRQLANYTQPRTPPRDRLDAVRKFIRDRSRRYINRRGALKTGAHTNI